MDDMKIARQAPGPVAVGAASDIPEGRFQIRDLGGREVGLTRLADGTIRAVRNFCPHKAAPICRGQIGGTWPPCEPDRLEFAREGEVLVCPWHGYEYDLRTGVEMFQDKPTRLVMYAVTERDGQVWVDTSQRAEA